LAFDDLLGRLLCHVFPFRAMSAQPPSKHQPPLKAQMMWI